MAVTLEQSGSWSDSSSGLGLVGVPVGPGVWCAVITLDAAPTAGDSFDLFWRDSLDGGAHTAALWRVDGIDSTADATLAYVSPPTPLLAVTYGALLVDQTIAVGPIEFQWAIYKVSDLTP